MKIITGLLVATSVLTLSGCGEYGTASAPTRNAAVGAAIGAVAGKSTGDHSDSRAVKGAALGALGGYIYGTEVKDRNKRNNGY